MSQETPHSSRSPKSSRLIYHLHTALSSKAESGSGILCAREDESRMPGAPPRHSLPITKESVSTAYIDQIMSAYWVSLGAFYSTCKADDATSLLTDFHWLSIIYRTQTEIPYCGWQMPSSDHRPTFQSWSSNGHTSHMPRHSVIQDCLLLLGEIVLPHASVLVDMLFLCFNSWSFFVTRQNHLKHDHLCHAWPHSHQQSYPPLPEIVNYSLFFNNSPFRILIQCLLNFLIYPSSHWTSSISSPFSFCAVFCYSLHLSPSLWLNMVLFILLLIIIFQISKFFFVSFLKPSGFTSVYSCL